MSNLVKFLAVIVVGLSAWSLYMLLHDPSPEERARKRSESIAATCRVLVTRKLKTPSTASFVSGSEAVQQLDSLTFQVTGAVDAENLFGAHVRNTYGCILRYDREARSWTPFLVSVDS